jgi:hypothetical protein
VARTREVTGGGRAVEVEPDRLVGWFTRFAARHGGLATVDGTADHVGFRAADGASADVDVPFGGLPAGAAPDGANPADPAAGLDRLVAHLAAPRRVGLVLVRLGGYSLGTAVGGVVEASTTGARLVHGRTRKGGSSSGRFARRRDNQARVALDAAADAVARFLLPVAATLDAVVLGGDTAALDELHADRRLATLLERAEPRVLDVPEPRRAVLDEAARCRRGRRPGALRSRPSDDRSRCRRAPRCRSPARSAAAERSGTALPGKSSFPVVRDSVGIGVAWRPWRYCRAGRRTLSPADAPRVRQTLSVATSSTDDVSPTG